MVPFQLSPESIRQLQRLLARTPEARPEHGIRIYISGICNGGPEWSLTLDAFDPEFDECCEFDGLKVIVERSLLESVGGLDVQYECYDDDDEAGGFLITALDPEVQNLYNRPANCGGHCAGCAGCGGCHGHCGCGCDDCDGDCDDCDGDCDHCDGDCDHCDGCE